VDRIKALLSKSLAYAATKDASFRYEKKVDGNIVQLDLLTDLPRIKEDESVFKVYGTNSSIDLCLVDGAEHLKDHVETLRINVRDGDRVESFEVNVPDAVGFLAEDDRRSLSRRIQGRLRYLLLLPLFGRSTRNS
jgi:hypothetical protein